jgi:hypothetical protein
MQWSTVISVNQELSLKAKVDGQPLFMPLFSAAEKELDADEMSDIVKATISKYLN